MYTQPMARQNRRVVAQVDNSVHGPIGTLLCVVTGPSDLQRTMQWHTDIKFCLATGHAVAH